MKTFMANFQIPQVLNSWLAWYGLHTCLTSEHENKKVSQIEHEVGGIGVTNSFLGSNDSIIAVIN